MKLRQKLFPKSIADAAGISFLLVMFQICYWFEVFVVLPLYYEKHNSFYTAHCLLATALLFNLVGNFVAVYMVDTSIHGRLMPSIMDRNWKFCEICESVTPPRSWHCNVCRTCILKRDHHCNFTACCIGHYNERYFLIFLFYLSICSIYCTYFNSYYLWRFSTFSLVGIIKIIFPLAMFIFGNDTSLLQLYRLICIISIVGMIATVSLFIYHIINIINGVTMYEKGKNIKDYDLGSPSANLKQVFGNRWYLTLISPFLKSELPQDGIHWEKSKIKTKKGK